MVRLSDVSNGDIITASRQNDINDYINDATEYIYSLYLKVAETNAPTAAKGILYFDTTASKFKASQDGSTFVDVIGGGSSFIWTTSVSGTSGTGLTLTVDNSASSGTIAQSIIINNTQTSGINALKIDMGTASVSHTGILLNFIGGYGIYSNVRTAQAVTSGYTLYCGNSSFNNNGPYDWRHIRIDNSSNIGGGYNTGITVYNYSTAVDLANYSGYGVFLGQYGVNGTALQIYGSSSVNCSTNGLMNITLSNTQSGASTLLKLDNGTSGQAHTSLLIKNTSTAAASTGISIDFGTTGAGYGIKFLQNSTNAGSIGLYWSTISNGNAICRGIYQDVINNTANNNNYGFYQGTVANFSGTGYGIYQNRISYNNNNAYGIYQNNIDNSATGTSNLALGWYVANLNDADSYRGQYFSLNYNVSSAFLPNITINSSEIFNSRTSTRTSGTTTDNYNVLHIKRTQIQNGVGGTFSSSGSILKLENISTQTAGTLTDTVNVLNLTQSATYTTGKIITGVVGSTERFKVHPMVADGASAIAYLFDTTTSLATTGAKIASFSNSGTEKFYISKDGELCNNATNKWILGALTTATVALDTTRYIAVTIDGTAYKLLVAT